jgi:phosphoadenosine phosphosulfate reductase
MKDLPLLTSATPPTEVFTTGRNAAGQDIRFACSFSVEDVVIIDLLHEYLDQFSVFAIDTGRLPEETYMVANALSQKYHLKIDWYSPRGEAVEQMISETGLFSFQESLENRKKCCFVRKVEPLTRALAGADGWITGMRRSQGDTRGALQPLEVDTVNGGLVKINPLTFWSTEQVWTYARERKLPVNRLYDQGYQSIGCAPCTRAVNEGEPERSGRWWWETPEHRECGLHRR